MYVRNSASVLLMLTGTKLSIRTKVVLTEIVRIKVASHFRTKEFQEIQATHVPVD
jgi:hypothetical protein